MGFKKMSPFAVSTNFRHDLRFESFTSSSGDGAQTFLLSKVVLIRISDKFFERSILLGRFIFAGNPRFFKF